MKRRDAGRSGSPPVAGDAPNQEPSRRTWRTCLFRGCLASLLCILIAFVAMVRSYHAWRASVRIAIARQGVIAVDTAVRFHFAAQGALPDTLERMCVSVEEDLPPILRRESLVDPWGTPLRYRVTSQCAFEVRSSGPDRRMDSADDLVN